MTLPDFLLIGAPKAGTTALHVALSQHPGLYLSRVKEPKFFLQDGPPPGAGGPGDAETFRKRIWRRDDYEALFDPAPAGVLCGESTTLYLHDRSAHLRIHRLIPDVRLVAVLRDPVDRAHSNWAHLRSAGLEPEANFLRACDLEPVRAAGGWAPFWRYVSLGRYGEQLAHLLSVFDREQVLVLLYRDLRERPGETLDLVCRFLGVPTGEVSDVPVENVTVQTSRSLLDETLRSVIRATSRVEGRLPTALRGTVSGSALRALQRAQRGRIPLSPADRVALSRRFESDIALLERTLGRSFSHWRDPHGREDEVVLQAVGRFGTAYRSIDQPT